MSGKRRLVVPSMEAYSWQSQARQYDAIGEPGIHLERHAVGEFGALDVVDCLLYRGEDGRLVGILNHYPTDSEWERAGNVNVWVHPRHRRQGIATALVADARVRWDLDPDRQRYTSEGIALVESIERDDEVSRRRRGRE